MSTVPPAAGRINPGDAGGNPLLAAALDYAARGWRVVPLNERQKNPWPKDWPNAASSDPAQVRAWWRERPESNVGVALGPGSGLVGVDVDSEEGERLLAELSAGDLPDTLHMTTGKGARLLYSIPAGLPRPPKTVVIKGADGKEALRFQSTGGQCVMPPSVHPSGKLYAWVEQHGPADRPAAPMPAWMQMLMCPPEGQPEQHESTAARAFTAGGDFNKRGSWDELLSAHGFKPAGRRDQVRYYTRPGKSGGVSVTLGYYRAKDGTPALFVFSGSIPELAPDKCYDLFGAFARLEHHGDFTAASRALEAMGFGPQRPAASAKGKGGAAAPVQAPGQKPWEVRPCGGGPKPGLDAAELFTRKFDPIKFTVADFLPEGLTVLAGKSKGGKSFLALQVGWAVAAGRAMSGRAVEQGDVLYLALEDPARRMAGRLHQLRPSVGYDPTPNFHIQPVGSWPRADQGGLFHIAEWLEANKRTARLVMVDTFAKFRTPGKANGNSYADDYDAVGGLAELLAHYAVSGLIIHHTRKVRAEDPFDEISGTVAISGASDTMMVLERERGSAEGRLYVTGRDIAEGTIPMTCDAVRHWTLGERIDGIDTTGRTVEVARGGSKLDECATWLRKFLAEFAYPAKEVDAAGKAAGFSFPTIKEAKSRLGKQGTGELSFRKFGRGEWWCGFGEPEGWKLRPIGTSELPNFRSPAPHRKDTGEGEPEEGF